MIEEVQEFKETEMSHFKAGEPLNQQIAHMEEFGMEVG